MLPEKEDVDLYVIAEDVLDSLESEAEKKNVSLSLTGERAIIKGIPNYVDEIVYNLCDNAVKYNRENGFVRVSLDADQEYFYIRISDNGIGIPEESLPHIFDRFYRTDTSRNSAQGGSGIGLSVVKKIIEDHGGYIWASGKEGEGTIIHFVLRKYEEADTHEQDPDNRR